MHNIETHIIKSWGKDSPEEKLIQAYVENRYDYFLGMYESTRYDRSITEKDRDPNNIYVVVTVDGKFAGGQILYVRPQHSEVKLPTEEAYDKFRISELFPHLETDTLKFAELKGTVRISEFRGYGVVQELNKAAFAAASNEGIAILISQPSNASTRGSLRTLDEIDLPYFFVSQEEKAPGLPRNFFAVAVNTQIELISHEMAAEGRGILPVDSIIEARAIGNPPANAKIVEICHSREKDGGQHGV